MKTLWKYGASPINWCNDDRMDMGDEYGVEDILSAMSDLGFEATEMGRKYPKDAAELSPLLKKYHLQLASAWAQLCLASPSLWDREFAEYEKHVKFLRDMGAPVVVTAEGSGSVHWDRTGDRAHRVPLTDDQWQTVTEGLTRAGRMCATYGLQLVFHPHLGTNYETQAEIVRLLDGTDSELVGLVLDTGHLAAAGINPVWILDHYPERVRHVHFKSIRRAVVARYHAGMTFLDAVKEGIFTVPGDGEVDFEPIVRRLSAMGYDGWCIIEAEQDPARAEPRHYMTMALDYLNGLSHLPD